MKIEHLAIWTDDLEGMKNFYSRFFSGLPGEKYYNPVKQFSSYFLSFEDGARLELMQMPQITGHGNDVTRQYTGLTHFAISVGSKEKVDVLTETLRQRDWLLLENPAGRAMVITKVWCWTPRKTGWKLPFKQSVVDRAPLLCLTLLLQF